MSSFYLWIKPHPPFESYPLLQTHHSKLASTFENFWKYFIKLIHAREHQISIRFSSLQVFVILLEKANNFNPKRLLLSFELLYSMNDLYRWAEIKTLNKLASSVQINSDRLQRIVLLHLDIRMWIRRILVLATSIMHIVVCRWAECTTLLDQLSIVANNLIHAKLLAYRILRLQCLNNAINRVTFKPNSINIRC